MKKVEGVFEKSTTIALVTSHPFVVVSLAPIWSVLPSESFDFAVCKSATASLSEIGGFVVRSFSVHESSAKVPIDVRGEHPFVALLLA